MAVQGLADQRTSPHDDASVEELAEGYSLTPEEVAATLAYYEEHKLPDGGFDVDLPTRIPANLEEEMDFDEEQLRSGVRIAEFY